MVYNVTKVYVLNNQVLYVDEGAISRDSSNYNLIEVITNVSGFGVEIAFELPNGVFSNRLGLTQQTASRIVPSDIAQLSSVSGEEWSVYSTLIPNAVLSAITSTTSQTLGFSLRFTQGISNVFYYDSINDFPTIGEGDKVYAFDDNGSDVFYVWRDNDYTTTDAEDFIVTYDQVYTTEKDVISVQGTIGGEAVALDPAWYQNKIVQDLNKLISDLNAINALISDASTGLSAKVNKSGDTMTGILTMLNDIAMSDNDITDMGNINSYTFEDGSLDTDAIKLDMLNQLFNLDPPVTSLGSFNNWKEAFASAIQDKFDDYVTIQNFNTNYYTKTQTDNLLDDKVDVTDYDNKVDEIENKLLAIEGAYVYRGKLTTSTTEQVEADKTLLTTFISDNFEGRQPTLGDVVKDSDGGEWYFDGSDWRFMGQDYIDLDNYYTKTESDGRYYTQTELNDGQLDNRYYTETEVDDLLDDKVDTTKVFGANEISYDNTDSGFISDNVQDVIDELPSIIEDKLNEVDALRYVGTFNAANETQFPGPANKGDLYKVSSYGVVDTVDLEVGDMIICNTDGTLAGETAKWDIIEGGFDQSLFQDHLDSTSNPHDTSLSNLIDTTIDSPQNNQALVHDGIDWKNRALSKTDVSLSNVENYGVASQAEAEAGTLNDKYMTPLRTEQAIANPRLINKYTSTASIEYDETDNSFNFIIPEV